jgi:hypothetical protein
VLCSTNLVEKVKVRKERVFGNMRNIMKTSIKNLPGGIFFNQLMFNSKNQYQVTLDISEAYFQLFYFTLTRNTKTFNSTTLRCKFIRILTFQIFNVLEEVK